MMNFDVAKKGPRAVRGHNDGPRFKALHPGMERFGSQFSGSAEMSEFWELNTGRSRLKRLHFAMFSGRPFHTSAAVHVVRNIG